MLNSALFHDIPSDIKDNFHGLYEKIKATDGDSRFPDIALESLLLRSANLVFSTTNSADLKNMLDASVRFDWSIVEEAGRATGTELLAPLMLSHRRLLIGDPKQLPPFGEGNLNSLLNNSENLRKAFEYGRPLLNASFNELGIDDLIERYIDPSYERVLAKKVKETFLLFESLYTEISNRQTAIVAASLLREQYRMHPDISDVVSSIFYKKPSLLTANITKNKRLKEPRPYMTLCKRRLPNTPIVFVDMPWKQQGNKSFGEKAPAYFNPNEIEAVIEVLSLLRHSPFQDKAPSLAVIAPYNEQVTRLSNRLSSEIKGRLAHLDEFHMDEKLVHTIDSFQGDEADIVIASLVRNNGRGYGKGLGILGDARRVNVLLSRAKWKLVIIGSLRFLKQRFPPGKTIPPDDELRFLKDLIRLLSDQKYGKNRSNNSSRDRGIAVVNYDDLMRVKSQ